MPTSKLRQDTFSRLPYAGASKNAQCIHWDRDLPGFGLRVYANGRRSFVCSYRVNGRKRLATLGRGDVLKLDTARKKAVAYLGQVAGGVDPKAISDTIKASGTVSALAKTYVERHAKLKKTTWQDDQSYLTRHLLPRFGSRLAAALSTDDVAGLHAEVGKSHPYTANRLLEMIRKMYNLANKWGLVPLDKANPASGVERFREAKRRRFLTPDELQPLAKAIDGEIDEYIRHAIWLLLLTGLRRGELLRAQWSEVDWDNRNLTVPKTKNGEALLAPLSHAAIARLKLVPKLHANPYIFCGHRTGRHLVNITAAWSRIRTAAGLEDLRIHDLRRTVGSWLVRDGASLHLVGAVLNHKDQKTTAGYAYFQTKERHRALDKHGRNVVNLIPQKRTVEASLQSSPANRVPPADSPQVHIFTRQALYDLVWSQSTLQIAKRLGISDVGLSKACRRAEVPTPERGYWAKLAVGKKQEQPPLPAAGVETPSVVTLRRRRRKSQSSGDTAAAELAYPVPVAC